MTANSDDIYIKADRNIEVAKKSVTLGDVLKIECVNPAMLARIRSTHLLTFHHPDNKRERRVVMSVLKVIQKIHEIYPEASVENIGETDFIVTYEEQDGKGGVIHVAKIVMVVMISFFGAAFSTMAFNNDVGVTKMFGQIYELLTGTKSNGFTILEFMYCIGIIIGILTFFNHFGKKRLSVDPTPMEVEMRLYENDIQTTLVETYSRKEKELDVDEKTYSWQFWDLVPELRRPEVYFLLLSDWGWCRILRTGHIQVSMLCSMKMPLQWAAVSEQSSLSIIPRYHTEAGWFRWRDFSVESL